MLRSLLLGCAVALLAAGPARAADFAVNDLGDGASSCPGACTLRGAIAAANAAPGADTITLPAGTVKLSAGALQITGPVLVQGPPERTTLDPVYTNRILDVSASAGAVTISRVVLSRSQSPDLNGGSALLMRGATVTLDRDVIVSSSNNLSGGAILQLGGTLAITDTEVRGSHAFRGGGLFVAAGSAMIDRTLWLSNDGSTGGGGAIYNNGGTLTVTNSTFADNSSGSGHGGAIYAAAGSTTLSNDTFEANVASGDDGGGSALWSDVAVTTSNVLFGNSAHQDSCAGVPIIEQGGSVDAARSCGLEVADRPVRLGPLEANGGIARSLLPWAGSAGVNTGNDATCTALDQRGATRARSAADHCDVGAVEGVAATAAPPPVVAGATLTPGAHVAVLDVTIDRGGLPTTYRIDYGPTAAYAFTTGDGAVPFAPGAGAQPLSIQFGEFDAATTYHYRVVVISAAGTATGPDRTFTTLPANQIAIGVAPAALVSSASVEFRFTPSPGVGELECALTGPGQSGDFAFCADSVSYELSADGAYAFTVRAEDGAASATRAFTLDRTPPPPPQLEQTGGDTFAFSSEPGATFECRIDDGAFAPCTSPLRVDGLPPGAHTLTVRSTDPAGNPSSGSSRAFTVGAIAQQTPTPSPTPTPTPEPGKTVVGAPVSGKVLVKRPGKGYVELDATQSIPLGSTVDTRKGTISLTAKSGQTATFRDGIFKITQTKTTTDLTLTEPLAPCRKGARAAAKKPKTRKLWGNGSGSFRTRGQYSAATVRGTEWLVQDSCAGTLTQVKKGVVSVFDQVKKKTIVLRAGKKYLARPTGAGRSRAA